MKTGTVQAGICIRMQWIWFALAIGYNMISVWRMQHGGLSLIDGRDPVASIVSLMIIVPVLLAGGLGYLRLYALSNLVCMLLVGYVGVMIHLVANWLDEMAPYASFTAWLSGVAINLFGVSAGLAGSWFAWRSAASRPQHIPREN